ARISVADSFDLINGQPNIVKNAIPFASLNDSRAPVQNGDVASPKVLAEDGVTKPFYISLLYKGNFDPLVIASGIDARLIEAEAKLVAGDITGMMGILNTLRGAVQQIGIVKTTVLPALPTPANIDAATSLYFREKALWTFGRG